MSQQIFNYRVKYGITHTETPSLELTTMIGCPLMCTFCPQKNLHKAYGKDVKYMTVETISTVLEKIPTNTRIDFSGMSEPWANPECTQILKKVFEKGFRVAIFTTLYGISKEQTDELVELFQKYDHQIEMICLHLPDSNGNMLGWKYTDDWKYAYEKITTVKLSKPVGCMTMDGSGRVHNDISHFASITYQPHLHTRADSLDIEQIGTQPIVMTPRHSHALTCKSTPFYDRNVLLPNGDVVLCCMDYNLKHIIGNLLDQTYEEIFKSEELMKLIEINEKNEFSKCSICKSCDNVRYI